jgi:predicted dehydrogenase
VNVSVKVRVGIVGAGHIANQRHIPNYREAGAEVLALADVVGDRAARLAAKWEIPHAFADYRQMLAMPELDAVSVCAPPFVHEEVSVAAFEAGKHVYLEKPPAMNEAEMVRIVAAGRKAGKLLMVGSNSVYWRQTQVLKEYIDSGALGEIYLIKSLGAGRRNIPRGWFRQRRLSGGGVGMDGGSHSLDRILYLLGTPKPVSVVARTYAPFASYIPKTSYRAIGIEEGAEADVPVMDVEDTVVAFVQFDTGCTLVLENAWAANISGGGGLWIYGTKAGASLNPLTLYGETDTGVLTDMQPVFSQGPQTHVEALAHFVECVREGVETQSPGERSVVTMRILDAIYRSASEGGREVRLE